MNNHYLIFHRQTATDHARWSRPLLLMGLCWLFICQSLLAQDNLVSTSANTPWTQPTFAAVAATSNAGTWTNLGNITDNSTGTAGTYGYIQGSATGGLFGGSGTYTGTVALKDGQTYGLTSNTTYYVGVTLSRGNSSSSNSSFQATISTYLGGVLKETSSPITTFSNNIGFYAAEDFDEVRVSLTGGFSVGSYQTGTAQIRVNNAFLRRYVLPAGYKCNTPTPMLGPGLTATRSGIGVWTPLFNSNLEDSDPNTHDTFLTGGISTIFNYNIEDNVNIYPAGTFAGFKIANNSVFGGSLITSSVVTTYLNGVEQETSNAATLLSGSIISTDGTVTVGFRTTKPFNSIQYGTVSAGLQVVSTTTFYYPVIIGFCDNPVTACNTPIVATQGNGTVTNYPLYVNSMVSSAVCAQCVVQNPDAIIDNDFTNYASIQVGGSILSDVYIGVKSAETGGYPIGTYVGFDVQDIALASINVGTLHKFTLYRNGVEVHSFTDEGAVGSGSFFTSTGRQLTGFKSPVVFDEVRMSIQALGGVSLAETRVYGVVLEKFCPVADLTVCNTPTSLTSPAYPIYVDAQNTGIKSGVGINNNLVNTSRLIDNNPANYMEIVLQGSLATSAAVAVANGANTFPAGTFAGFDIENSVLIGANALTGITVTTLDANGNVIQTINSSNGLISANSSVVSGSGRQTVGFVASQPFSRIKLTVNQTAALSLGSIRVYGAVIQKFCSATLACDVMTPIVNTTHPVYVNGVRTGIDYAGCVGCSLNNTQNVVNSNTSDYASFVLVGNAGSSSAFSVANPIDTYPVNSFAGFDMETDQLSADFLSTATIELYNNGSLVQTGTGNALILGALNSGVTNYSRQIVGVVANVPYDEVRIVFNEIGGVSLGNIKIYNAVVKTFCPATPIACDETVWLNTIGVINSARTGVTSVVSGGGSLADPWNAVSASTTDYTRLSLPASGGTTGSVSVAAPAYTFPAGSTAGFFIRDVNNFAQGSLFNAITIRTYNNGVLQQSSVQGNLINVAAIIPIFGPGGTVYSVGFKTNADFDEVKIEVASIGGVLTVTDIFGAFVTTYGKDGCSSLPVSLVSFSAKASGRNAELNWVTASERNSALFEVQHSTNNRTFETIATIEAKGTTTQKNEYSYTHVSPNPSVIHYYRLNQKDRDGSSTLYASRSVKFDGYVGIELKAATTATRGVKALIEYGDENLSKTSTVYLLDVSGRKRSAKQLTLEKGQNVVEFDGNGLNSGVYLLHLENASGNATVKVVLP